MQAGAVLYRPGRNKRGDQIWSQLLIRFDQGIKYRFDVNLATQYLTQLCTVESISIKYLFYIHILM